MGTRYEASREALPTTDLAEASPEASVGQAQKRLVELQLRMATSSINHEYARMKFDGMSGREDREDLLEYMHDCRREYFDARSALEAYDPYSLAEFEADLMRQKQATLTHYSA